MFDKLLKKLSTLSKSASFVKNKSHVSGEPTPLTDYLKKTTINERPSGIPSIDCIYVINLDHRKDRWNRLSELFSKMNLNVNRFSAIIGSQLTTRQRQEMSGPYPILLSGDEIGCLLSHLSIIKDAYDRGFSTVWILEDDVEFLEEAKALVPYIKNLCAIDKEWDILYTDTNSRDPLNGYFHPIDVPARPHQHLPPFNELAKRVPVGFDLERLGVRYGMGSVIYSRRGLEKVYNYFAHLYLWFPFDWDIHLIPDIREYGITRDMITNLRHGFAGNIKRGMINQMLEYFMYQDLFQESD